jgi:hypothetical protein
MLVTIRKLLKDYGLQRKVSDSRSLKVFTKTMIQAYRNMFYVLTGDSLSMIVTK